MALSCPSFRSGRKRLAVFTCFATMFMLGVAVSLLGPSLPALARRVEATLPQAGLFFTLFSGGSVVATLLVARWNDHPVRHALLIGGALVLAAGHWLISASDTLLQAAAAIFLSGLALSTMGTGPNAIIADLFGERSGQALNALHLATGVGAFVGPLAVGGAIRLGADYRLAYVLAGIGSAGVAVLWAISLPPRPVRGRAGKPQLPTGVLASLGLVLLLALLYTGTEQTAAGWLYSYAVDLQTVDAATAGIVTSLYWLAILGGRLAAARVLRNTADLALLKACALVGGAGIAGILAARLAPGLLWVGVTLTGLGFGPIFPTALAVVCRLAPGRSGAASSLVVAAGSVGTMILPAAAGSLIPVAGLTGSMAMTLAPLAAIAGCAWALQRHARRRA